MAPVRALMANILLVPGKGLFGVQEDSWRKQTVLNFSPTLCTSSSHSVILMLPVITAICRYLPANAKLAAPTDAHTQHCELTDAGNMADVSPTQKLC